MYVIPQTLLHFERIASIWYLKFIVNYCQLLLSIKVYCQLKYHLPRYLQFVASCTKILFIWRGSLSLRQKEQLLFFFCVNSLVILIIFYPVAENHHSYLSLSYLAHKKQAYHPQRIQFCKVLAYLVDRFCKTKIKTKMALRPILGEHLC